MLTLSGLCRIGPGDSQSRLGPARATRGLIKEASSGRSPSNRLRNEPQWDMLHWEVPWTFAVALLSQRNSAVAIDQGNQ